MRRLLIPCSLLLAGCPLLGASSGSGPAGGAAGQGPPSLGAPTHRVTNPNSSVQLAVYASLPSGQGPHDAVVLVPGGDGDSSESVAAGAVDAFNDAGIAVFSFDPDGRGESGGEEDLNGVVQQAGLEAVLSWVSARSDVNRVGVISTSFGIAMSTGALAGQTDAAWLIDWEGPSSRGYIAGCPADNSGMGQLSIWTGIACGDDAFWSEREAVDSIGALKIPYLRYQRARDHVHGDDRGHALELLNAARAGGVPWVRLNDTANAAQWAAMPLPNPSTAEMEAQLLEWTLELFEIARR